MVKNNKHRVKNRTLFFLMLILFAACQTTPANKTEQIKEPPQEVLPQEAAEQTEKKEIIKKPVTVTTIQEAGRILSLHLSAGLPQTIKSVAVLPPEDMSDSPNKTFETRISDVLTNRLQPLLPPGCRLVERAKIKKVFIDSITFGDDDRDNDIFDEAGADVNIVGSYTILKIKNQVELSYRAVSLKNAAVLAVSPTIFLPASILKDTGTGGIMLITRGQGITRAQGGDEILKKVSELMKQSLNNKGIPIIESSGKGSDDPFYTAQREGARLLILLEVEGKKEYTNFGNIKGTVSITANIYKLPEKEIIFTQSGKKQVLAVSEDEAPVLRGVEYVMGILALRLR